MVSTAKKTHHRLFSLALPLSLPLFLSSMIAFAKDEVFKRSDDGCPKGQHEVTISEESSFVDKKKQKITSKVTYKVCRDNKDSKDVIVSEKSN